MYKVLVRRLLVAVKLPVALISAFVFPALFVLTFSSFAEFFDAAHWMFWAAAGVALLLGWTMALRWSVTRFMLVLEHEMIHVLLAWLTGLKVERLEVNHNRDGGLAMIESPANWLVMLGPYFVPLTLYLCAFIVHALPIGETGLEIVLGALSGYEFAVNVRELHPHQSDFATAGWWFTILFLPSAILLTYGGAFHYALTGNLVDGWTHMLELAKGSFQQSWEFVVAHLPSDWS